MLDFSQVTPQIQAFTTSHARALPQLRAALDEARERLRESPAEWEATRDKIARGKTSWLVAEWLEPPDVAFAAPERPLPHTILAADGSQIVSDRHDIALCYLLNVGMIALRYGGGERALLTSRASLHRPEPEMLDESQGEQDVIAPRRLAGKRLLVEFAGLAELIEAHAPRQHPMLAMSDGTLILWPWEVEKEDFRIEMIHEFESCLARAFKQNTPVIGYISQPASRDVVNSLRVFRCPHPEANCDAYCPNRNRQKPDYKAPDCAGTEGITDADLFFSLLEPGERSAVFGSSSKILKQYRQENRVRFFYLHTGRETARVEMPDWVAADPELLARTHALCWDQARKGDGYPVALAEAHEQAIVRAPEKQAFFHLLEKAFVSERVPPAATQKAVSKRARRV